MSEALLAVQTIDTEIHVYSLGEEVEKLKAKREAENPQPPQGVRKTLLTDMPFAGRHTIHLGPDIHDPQHFPDPRAAHLSARGDRLFTINNKPAWFLVSC